VRARWRERTERNGWDVRYTVIGGRFLEDPLARNAGTMSDLEVRAVSQAFVASTRPLGDPSEDVTFWSSIVRKVVQRGTRPVIRHHDSSAFAVPVPAEPLLRAAIAGPVDGHWELDPRIELHPTFEVPFWDFQRPSISETDPTRPQAETGDSTPR
jgi:hypothetical protein